MKADPRIELRKNASDWLRVNVTNRADAALVEDLGRAAAAAHAPAPGEAAKPPPEGADLARRRRFH